MWHLLKCTGALWFNLTFPLCWWCGHVITQLCAVLILRTTLRAKQIPEMGIFVLIQLGIKSVLKQHIAIHEPHPTTRDIGTWLTEILVILLKTSLGPHSSVWEWNASDWCLYLDSIPKCGTVWEGYGNLMGKHWRKWATGVVLWLLIAPPTSCLLFACWLKMQGDHLLPVPAMKPLGQDGWYPLIVTHNNLLSCVHQGSHHSRRNQYRMWVTLYLPNFSNFPISDSTQLRGRVWIYFMPYAFPQL